MSQFAVDNVKVVVLTDTCEKNGIFGKGAGRCLVPSITGQGLVYAVVIQLRPEQLLQRFEPAKVLQ